jgi:hypothetical protein
LKNGIHSLNVAAGHFQALELQMQQTNSYEPDQTDKPNQTKLNQKLTNLCLVWIKNQTEEN